MKKYICTPNGVSVYVPPAARVSVLAFIAGCLSFFLLLLISGSAYGYEPRQLANPGMPEALKEVGIFEKLGESVSIEELEFTNEEGETVSLSSYFSKGKPVLLSLVYYECPSLCSYVLNGLLDSLKDLQWTPGKEFEVVTVSIDHREDHELASRKKKAYMKEFGREGAEAGWHFLTGDEKNIQALADQVGFGFKYDEVQEEYAHGATLIILTPEGRVSRYLYGIEYPEKDMRLGLLEASNGTIGTVIDRIILFCYRYDPITRKYSIYAIRLMNAGATGTAIFVGGWLALYWRRQRRLMKDENLQSGSGEDDDHRQGG